MNVATFGEIMLHLSPAGRERFFQSPSLQAVFGGAEANVAVSLANFGNRVRFISVLPDNPIADGVVADLKKQGICGDYILRKPGRLGIYFSETGANQRPSRVVYDREYSAIARAGSGDIDWQSALDDITWLHVSGITPAISRSAADLTIQALSSARARGITVSVDLNYRAKLWQYGKTAPEVMSGIVALADVCLANEEDCQHALGLKIEGDFDPGKLDFSHFEKISEAVLQRYPNLKRLAVTMRESHSADYNIWSAVLRNRSAFYQAPSYKIRNIVDRIGAGDAFAAGLIHGLDQFPDSDEDALRFAVAASCLKHSIPGDFNRVTVAEVMELMAGDSLGRVKR